MTSCWVDAISSLMIHIITDGVYKSDTNIPCNLKEIAYNVDIGGDKKCLMRKETAFGCDESQSVYYRTDSKSVRVNTTQCERVHKLVMIGIWGRVSKELKLKRLKGKISDYST